MSEEAKPEINIDWYKYQEYRKYNEKIKDDERKSLFDPNNEKDHNWKSRLKNRTRGAAGFILGSAALASYGVPGLGPVVQGIATTTIVFSSVSNMVGQVPFFIEKKDLIASRLTEEGKPIKSSLLAGTRGMVISPVLALYNAAKGTYQKIQANRCANAYKKAELENKSQNSYHAASGYAKVFGVVIAAPLLFTAGCFEQMIRGTKHTKLGVIAAMKSAGASFRKSENVINEAGTQEFQNWLKSNNNGGEEKSATLELFPVSQKVLSKTQTSKSKTEIQQLSDPKKDDSKNISWIDKVGGKVKKKLHRVMGKWTKKRVNEESDLNENPKKNIPNQ